MRPSGGEIKRGLRCDLDILLQVYNSVVERKIFWITFTVLGLVADFVLPLWWAVGATIPIVFIAWWVAYRSEWF
jgi:hypothetical protein